MLNTAIIMGRLTAEPELRHTSNGIAVSSFTLAVDRSYAKAGTEKVVDFIDVVVWRSTAEFVCKYFHKGQLVAVQGSIQMRSYSDKEGIKRRTFEIVADNVHFAEKKRDYDESSQTFHTGESNTTDAVPNYDDNASYSNGSNDDFQQVPTDDDLPF